MSMSSIRSASKRRHVFRIVYPVDAYPEALDTEGECPPQDYVVGTVAGRGLKRFVRSARPAQQVRLESWGRAQDACVCECGS